MVVRIFLQFFSQQPNRGCGDCGGQNNPPIRGVKKAAEDIKIKGHRLLYLKKFQRNFQAIKNWKDKSHCLDAKQCSAIPNLWLGQGINQIIIRALPASGEGKELESSHDFVLRVIKLIWEICGIGWNFGFFFNFLFKVRNDRVRRKVGLFSPIGFQIRNIME